MKEIPQTILVVDDNEDDVILLKHAFRYAGVINPLQAVSNGTDAIRYLRGDGIYAERERFPFPALLLLDLHLPLQSGFDVLEWLRGNIQPALKAVVCTGTATPAEIEKAYKLGAEGVLQKTSDYKQFVTYLVRLPELRQVPRPAGIEWAFA
jgi:CheY-like chemotaxis protein